jgi:hypothetical protein
MGPVDGSRIEVARVVYASESNIRDSVYAEMERIRHSALKHNVPAGIHTALLYQSGWFVQWKEGPGDSMLKVMDRVKADKRHRNMRVVHQSRGPRLLNGPWSMAIVQAGESPEEMTERVMKLRQRLEEGVQVAPTVAWRHISTPMQHPGAAYQGDPDAFQRLLVCSAVGNAAFDLVAWLAHLNQQPVVHRRFAGEQGLDVGTDYVDFSDGDRVDRVIAMARAGLLLPLTRAFLADYSHVVLLLSGEPVRDNTLVSKVLQAVSGLGAPPMVIGVAAQPEAHTLPFSLMHTAGVIYLDVQADPEDPKALWTQIHPLLDRWRETGANSSFISRPGVANSRDC